MDFQISKVFLFIVFNISAIQASKLDMNFIVAVLDEFQMRNPTIWNRQNELGIDLMKILFQLGQYCKIKTNLVGIESETSDMLLLFNDVKEIEAYFQMESNSQSTHVILLQNPDFKTIMNLVTTSINERVFFINLSSKEVFEFYKINDVSIQNKLGHFEDLSYKFQWNDKVNSDFFVRRSDFYSLTLKAMTEATGRQLMLDPSYTEKAPFFSSNQTYLVTQFTTGLYYDVLLELQKMLKKRNCMGICLSTRKWIV